MRDFHRLKVWRSEHRLVPAIYNATADFPQRETYGLTSQLRHAAVSITANIAEGCGRNTEADFARFMQMVMRSASEVEYELLLAHDLAFIGDSEYLRLVNEVTEVKRMLTGLIQKLKENPSR